MTLPYIINVALVLGACLCFYKLLLRRETFYKMNRFLLILCLGIAFSLPLLTVPAEISLRKASIANGQQATGNQQLATINSSTDAQRQQQIVNQQPAPIIQPPTSNIIPSSDGPIHHSPFTIDPSVDASFSIERLTTWLFWTYWFGVIIFGASFLFQLVLLLYRSFRYPVIIDGKYRIVEINGDKAPCSFGNTIFINPSKYDWETYNQILLHEKIHVSQRHTIDIIFAELVLIFQWFNPFAWIYRHEIENNLEYLTDDQLVQHKAIDKKTYQLSLLKVSAPNFPLNLTTNYNQSTLKKRIAMMNTKRSNLHTAWKYFFLLPVLAILACVLNEPKAKSQTPNEKTEISPEKNETINIGNLENTGYWFAIIKGDEVHIRFSDQKLENDQLDFKSGHSFSGTNFKLADLGTLPKGTSGTFNIIREAGKMEMTGKFDGDTGMGTYKFIADKAYFDHMNKELKETIDEDEQLAFFFMNIRKDYVQLLKAEGFTKLDVDAIIGGAAMGIDAAYIKSIRNAGFKDVDMEEMISLKAMGVDEKYIQEIRSAGYKNVTTDQLVSFKAQGIDKEYITKVRQMKTKDGDKDKDNDNDEDDDADDIVSFKAMGIDEEFINSFKAIGMKDIPHDQLVAFKAIGVTPEYIKGWYNLGFKNIDADEFVGMKSQNVTPEFMKSFTDMGYKNIDPEDLVSFRALGVTPEYIKSFEAIGYKNIDFDEFPALKSQGITPEFIKSFEALGFKNTDLEEFVAVKAMGVTPAYIKEMRAKGFNWDKLEKYVQLKSID